MDRIMPVQEVDFKHVLQVCEELPPYENAYGSREIGKVCALGAVLVVLDEMYDKDGEQMSADFMEQVEPEMFDGLGLDFVMSVYSEYDEDYIPLEYAEEGLDITEMIANLNDGCSREVALWVLEMFLS